MGPCPNYNWRPHHLLHHHMTQIHVQQYLEFRHNKSRYSTGYLLSSPRNLCIRKALSREGEKGALIFTGARPEYLCAPGAKWTHHDTQLGAKVGRLSNYSYC